METYKKDEALEELENLKRDYWSEVLDTVLDEKSWNELLEGQHETPLHTRAALKKEFKDNMLKPIESKEGEDSITEAFSLIFNNYHEILSMDEAASMDAELKSISKKIMDGSLNPSIKGFTSIAEALQLSDNFLNCIEKVGNYYYNKGFFKEASTLFTALVDLKPSVPGYWLSLGHTQRALNEIDNATAAYLAAGTAGLYDPLPYLLAAHINSQDNKEASREYLTLAKTLIDELGDTPKYTEEIKVIEKALNSQKE